MSGGLLESKGEAKPFPWRELCPVIRSHVGGTLFVSGERCGAALYEETLVLFEPLQGGPMPESVHARDEGEALARSPLVRSARAVQLEEISEACAVLKGKTCTFRIETGMGETHRFALPREESRHLVEGLRHRLGERLSFVDDGAGWSRQGASGWWKVLAALGLALAGGLAAAALIEHPAEPDWGRARGPLAAAMLALIYLVDLWRRRRRRAKGTRPRFRSRVLGGVLRSCGFVLLVAALAAPRVAAFALAGVDGVMTGAGRPAPGGAFLACLFLVSSLPLLYAGYRLRLRDALLTPGRDQRPPILFVSSAGDEGAHTFNPAGAASAWTGLEPVPALHPLGPLAHAWPARLLRLALGVPADHAEQQLGCFASRRGPYLALGQADGLRSGGASRSYSRHEGWADRAQRLIRSAACIVLQPAQAAGDWSELRYVREMAQPQRVLLSLASFSGSQQHYEELRLRFEQEIARGLPRSAGTAAFVRFGAEWAPSPLAARYLAPWRWPLSGMAVDFAQTLAPFLDKLAGAIVRAKHFEPKSQPTVARAALSGVLWSGAALLATLALSRVADDFLLERLLAGAALAKPLRDFDGEPLPYRWRLGEAWALQERDVPRGRVSYRERHGLASVTIDYRAWPALSCTSPLALLAQEPKEAAGEKVLRESRQTVFASGRDWLQTVTVSSRPGAATPVVRVRRAYGGPEAWVILSATAAASHSAEPAAISSLRKALDGLSLPPRSAEAEVLANATITEAIAHPVEETHPTLNDGPVLRLGRGWTENTEPEDRGSSFFFRGDSALRVVALRFPAAAGKDLTPERLRELLKDATDHNEIPFQPSPESGTAHPDWQSFIAAQDGQAWCADSKLSSAGLYVVLTRQAPEPGSDEREAAALLTLARANARLPIPGLSAGSILGPPWQEMRGAAVPYRWKLGRNWQVVLQDEPNGNFKFKEPGSGAVAVLGYRPARTMMMVDPAAVLAVGLKELTKNGIVLGHETLRLVQSSGREWLEETALIPAAKATPARVAVLRAYGGPEAQSLVLVTVPLPEPAAPGTATPDSETGAPAEAKSGKPSDPAASAGPASKRGRTAPGKKPKPAASKPAASKSASPPAPSPPDAQAIAAQAALCAAVLDGLLLPPRSPEAEAILHATIAAAVERPHENGYPAPGMRITTWLGEGWVEQEEPNEQIRHYRFRGIAGADLLILRVPGALKNPAWQADLTAWLVPFSGAPSLRFVPVAGDPGRPAWDSCEASEAGIDWHADVFYRKDAAYAIVTAQRTPPNEDPVLLNQLLSLARHNVEVGPEK
jgi:hypothetical protein